MNTKHEMIWDAAKAGDKAVLQQYLDGASAEGFKFEKKDKTGWTFTALGIAGYHSHTEIVTMLVKAGADVNYQDSWEGWTALIWASREGHTTTVQALIGAGTALNLQQKGGWTALMLASNKGHTVTVQALTGAGAELDLQNQDGDTALMLASQQGNTATVQALLEEGADRSIRDKNNKTAAEVAKTPEIRALIENYTAAPHVMLTRECHATVVQFACVPALRDAIQQRDELQREFTALNAAKTNFKEIARVGTTHKAAAAAVLQERLSEEDYLTLADRHAALVQKMTAACKELVDAEDYDAVAQLGAKLKQLNSLDAYSLPSYRNSDAKPAALPCADLRPLDCSQVEDECNTLVAQLANTTVTGEAIRRRDELLDALDALKAAMADFEAIGHAGKALKAANAELAQLPLSEEDYLTLSDRHATLVQKVTTTCAELADAGEFDALDRLTTKLEELKALDLSALPQSWANDPVHPPALPATAEEGEDDGASDPVFVPAQTGDITLA